MLDKNRTVCNHETILKIEKDWELKGTEEFLLSQGISRQSTSKFLQGIPIIELISNTMFGPNKMERRPKEDRPLRRCNA
ncbi:hypothetical protein M3Y98_00073000 [Aphelenchoides besseyi]|nr:hypothetical protein M3Y98_00073000 [Aphelenchoides besseyi]